MPPPGLPWRVHPFSRTSLLRRPYRRPLSSRSDQNHPLRKPSVETDAQTSAGKANLSRLSRLNAHLPRFLQHFTNPLLSAPISSVTAFLILHELTAVVPLIGLTLAFHYTNYLPPWFAEGKWVSDGVQRFGRYFKKKGWLGVAEEAELEREARMGENGEAVAGESKIHSRLKWWNKSEGAVKWVVEIATAYALIKVLMPVRVAVSAWWAPGFAKMVVIPAGRGIATPFRRMMAKGSKGG